MRQPLNRELNAEDRAVARRWAAVVGSVYLVLALGCVLAAVLSTRGSAVSGADRAGIHDESSDARQRVGEAR